VTVTQLPVTRCQICPSHRRVPARQPHWGPDRALPSRPSQGPAL